MLAGTAARAECRFDPPDQARFDPAPRATAEFTRRHADNLERARQRDIGLLFIGDSITWGWRSRAHGLWNERFGAYRPANFGISGDLVQQLAWRIASAELDGIDPRVVIVQIGTNNLPARDPAQLAGAIRAAVALLQCRLPHARVLLLGLLPRDTLAQASGRVIPAERFAADIDAVNADLARLDDGERVRFVDAGARFRRPDGSVDRALLPDGLHPGADGYRALADAIAPILATMLH